MNGFICGGASIGLTDYDAVQKSVVMEGDIFCVMQRFLADGAFRPTKCRTFSVVRVQEESSLYWFAQTFLLFHVNLHEPDSEYNEFAFDQYFDMTFPVDEMDEKLNCVWLRWAADDGLDHFVNFNTADIETIEADERYGLVPFSSIFSVHHIVSSTYFVPLNSLQLP